MHCKQCGAEINDGAKFCGVCGTPTVAAAASTAGDAIYVEARPIESLSRLSFKRRRMQRPLLACKIHFASPSGPLRERQ